MYKLSKTTKRYLLTLPESGLGYQIIIARKAVDDNLENFVVFNSEIVVENNQKLKFYSNTLIGYCYPLLLDSLQSIDLFDIKIVGWKSSPSTSQVKSSNEKDDDGNQKNVFIRPSIYEKDYRIDYTKNSLLPGSYITTMECFKNCNNNQEDPYDKFALPDQQNQFKVYYVKYPFNKVKKEGVFENAFGKSGGGTKVMAKDYGEIIQGSI